VVDTLSFDPPVTHVYNPLDYAAASHEDYVQRYARKSCEVLLLGMNPGPFGMAQTGVPFGDVELVRDWLGVEAPVGQPAQVHPKRPIEGFACTRREVSGSRLWGWARDRFREPDVFFDRFYVHNYCPLCFMEESGRNFTPDKLRAEQKATLFTACDQALADLVSWLDPHFLVGVGAFAEARIRAAVRETDATIGRIPHPSPASPVANRGWAPAAEAAFEALGVSL
jgi:single-strand selective monofunctional uracil DNA glycosylase